MADIVGRHSNTIAIWRSSYLARGVKCIRKRPGGRRNELMAEDSEREFMASYLASAEAGEMGDPAARAAFTQTSRTIDAGAVADDPRPVRVATFDEARVGRINRPVRCWAPAGVRPLVVSQTIREFMNVYSAVCPLDGTIDSLIMPTRHAVTDDAAGRVAA